MNPDQDKAFRVIGGRNVWEQKQRLYYLLRHDGIPRLNKPFPNAADAHFPLIDMTINDLKPFWISQAFSGNRLCDFLAMSADLEPVAESAADFMTFELRYYSDFRLMLERAVDIMLLCGRSIFKTTWDHDKKQVKMRAINPQFIIMDKMYDDLQDADWFIEVVPISVPQYQRTAKYKKDKGIIDKIRGKPDWTNNQFFLDKALREGITNTSNQDQIILWNRYEKTPTGWLLSTKCPFEWDVEICPDQKLPVEWQGESLLPLNSITMEIKDEGWFSPRGIAELNAPFEAYCTKLWNDTSDYMSYVNTPMYTSDHEIPNIANKRFEMGEYIPGGLQEVQRSQPPISLSEQINFTRQISERRSRTPDFGQFAPDDQSGGGSKPITATQSRIAAGLQAVGADHNGDTFREVRLAKIFKNLWALYVQYKPARTTYFISNQLKELPAQAVSDRYLIIPAGGAGTKQERLQRATARYELLRGDPDIDQIELKKELVSADDSRLVSKLVIGQSLHAAKEAEDEAMEIGIMLIGFPATVAPGEDHAARLNTLIGFLEKQMKTGAPVDPIGRQRIMEHLVQHFQYLQQTQPKVAAQFKQHVQQLEMQEQQPQNVAPMPQQQIA